VDPFLLPLLLRFFIQRYTLINFRNRGSGGAAALMVVPAADEVEDE
jgi:hypothetical protein